MANVGEATWRRWTLLEPLPETSEALRALALHGEAALGIHLYAMAHRVGALVPDLVGLSLCVIEDRVSLTLVASDELVAHLDSVQHLDGGACVAAVDRLEPLNINVAALLDEDRWQLYAQAVVAAGVASSLSLPIMSDGRVVGGVNLYAFTNDAFTGLHGAIAEAVGSDARLAVANADLSFRTRKQAMEPPTRVREGSEINIALRIIAASQGVNIPIAGNASGTLPQRLASPRLRLRRPFGTFGPDLPGIVGAAVHEERRPLLSRTGMQSRRACRG